LGLIIGAHFTGILPFGNLVAYFSLFLAPFLPPYFGVLAAFLFEWLWDRHGKNREKSRFLESIREELTQCEKQLGFCIDELKLTEERWEFGEEGHMLPTDMWKFGASDFAIKLIPYKARFMIASLYFKIESYNFEVERFRHVGILAETGSEMKQQEADKKGTIFGGSFLSFPLSSREQAENLYRRLGEKLEKQSIQLREDVNNLLKQDIWR